MLNLRQLSHAAGEISSENGNSFRLSISFRPPSDFLGNIGEPLDHGQAGRMQNYDSDDDDSLGAAGEQWVGLEEGSLQPEGPSFARWNEQIEVSLVPASHSTESASERKDIEITCA